LISCHEHNEHQRTPELINKIRAGAAVALVSDAGTPSVSDPGYRLVRAAVVHGLDIFPIPGVSAVVTALSASGLPTDTFVFIGFPLKKKGKRIKQLQSLVADTRTLVFYESPRRVAALMGEIISIMGNRRAVLAREMTKIHEEFVRGTLSEIHEVIADRSEVKGECTLLVDGASAAKSVSEDDMVNALRQALGEKGARLSSVSKAVARQYDLPRKAVYEMALNIQEEANGSP
jgi:16S rRNA (cytidine1402-2'-O)-methyltransferase